MTSSPRFACDAMLGKLARWLRAAGYDAFWQEGIDDWDLVRLAQRDGRVLLTSDTGILRIGIVRDGDLPSLFIPHGLKHNAQLAFVLGRLRLPIGEPRCMACGGQLIEVDKEKVRERVPPRSWNWQQQYYACDRCGRLFWQGTHWQRIGRQLDAVARELDHPSTPTGEAVS
ncbi:MAG: Mut7-C RNAse domain-containing protein [Gemmataceae bacterium]